MRFLISAALVLMPVAVTAASPGQRFPSCDLRAQHALRGEVAGRMRDPGQAHVSVRTNILQADIGSAGKAGVLTQRQAERLWKRAEAVRTGADGYTRTQGFLSAGERASYDRELDSVAERICSARR